MRGKRQTAAYFAVVAVLLESHPSAQGRPDFSGSWVLESASSDIDIPQALSISQTLVGTTVRGEPMKPFFKDITVTRTFANGSSSETYQIASAWSSPPAAPPTCLGASPWCIRRRK
jgi:hypothetical protein